MDYKSTLNLPKTKFKMKANLAQREPEVIKQWEKTKIYEKIQAASINGPHYILHDGPPYANGHIHIGHALNKILKDIILRSKRMNGYYCPFIPGWDCHGLPIEHNVDAELGDKKKDISILAFRKACRTYAGKWVKKQNKEFQRLGIFGDWHNPYLTINYTYEAAIAREFNRFLESGSVTRSKKPVHWCSSCRTALAEAEVDYADHTSTSIYVKFPLNSDLGDVVPELAQINVDVVIWTTTPWTLPANLAIALHPDFTYVAVKRGNDVLIIAEGLVEKACADFGGEYEILASLSAKDLEGLKCKHPFLDRDSLIVTADYVTLESGTGCVHTAPGHGREDYLTGIRYGLDVLSPVDSAGVFTEEAGIYAGLAINEANAVICADLLESGHLLYSEEMGHSYPHCWRCKKPVIFRATEQWFISMDKNDLRQKTLDAIKDVQWTPGWGQDRIRLMVESRPDWCLSRQRAWGVPITAIMCEKCGEIQNDSEVNEKIHTLFLKEGADAWYSHEINDFLGEGKICPKCGGSEFFKEQDILDVWFDSGTSHAAVLEERPELSSPADLYLEGSDQHRGWFQSSLLASVGNRGVAPFKGVLTHGFVVDAHGKKMSKSVGNVVAPSEIIDKYGAEILRLWVASEDYRDEIKVSDNIMLRLSDSYRKVRNTIRYLLGNLYDFDPDKDKIPYEDLAEIDQWALLQLELFKRKVTVAYKTFEFHTIYQGLVNFCTVTMSSFYLDIIKDRLYTAAPNSLARRGAQTVLYELVDTIVRLIAPILPFTAAEIWEHLPEFEGKEEDVAMASMPSANPVWYRDDLQDKWSRLIKIRSEVTKALEIGRVEKIIGHSLEAEVLIVTVGDVDGFMVDKWQILKEITIVSDLSQADELDGTKYVSEEIDGLSIQVRAASAEKCDRCWVRSKSVGDNAEHPLICEKCLPALAEIL